MSLVFVFSPKCCRQTETLQPPTNEENVILNVILSLVSEPGGLQLGIVGSVVE